MADEPRVYGNRWKVVRELGKGGQGIVYEVEDAPKIDVSAEVNTVQKGLATINAIATSDDKFRATLEVVNALRPLVRPNTNPKGALKELLPIDQAINAETALTRMKTELETLKAVKHPSLVSVLDDQIEERWFVTELFHHGTLRDRIDLYKGHVLQALTAFRPLVEAVSKLHERQTIHRDIKPDNVFIGDDARLVLGDCGLAIKLDAADRITDTYENVGSWAWMPAWALGMRVDDVKPNFDVYSLGKLLWAMLAGKPRLRLWYFDAAENDLRRLFPNSSGIHFIHRLLKRCVVEHEHDCEIPDATQMLVAVDQVLEAIQSGAQVPNAKRSMKCRFCGLGSYTETTGYDAFATNDFRGGARLFVCDHCGHIELFTFRHNQIPPAWKD